MTQCDRLVDAGTDLAGDIYLRAVDAGWGPFKLQLGAAHRQLTSETALCVQNEDGINAADAGAVDDAVAKCGIACDALESADTYSLEQAAMQKAYEAIASIGALLPPAARALI